MKKVEIIPYQSHWPAEFAKQAEKIKDALGHNVVAIYHIGSTSVPNLDSKDKIDIILQVKDAKPAISILGNMGFEYGGDWNIPFKYGLRYRHEVSINLHMFDFAHPAIESNLLFRDYLRSNSAACTKYTKLKHQILEDPNSQLKDNPLFYNYTLRKSAFIKSILKNTDFSRIYIQYCTDEEEWQAAKDFRNKYFFHPNSTEDKYTWTFNHHDHKHFVLYQGVDIVGYAHIQIWPQARAALRIMAIEENLRNKGLGAEFMQLIELWLKQKELKSLHIESSIEALSFYTKLGFKEMPFDDPDHHESCPNDIAIGKKL